MLFKLYENDLIIWLAMLMSCRQFNRKARTFCKHAKSNIFTYKFSLGKVYLEQLKIKSDMKFYFDFNT